MLHRFTFSLFRSFATFASSSPEQQPHTRCTTLHPFSPLAEPQSSYSLLRIVLNWTASTGASCVPAAPRPACPSGGFPTNIWAPPFCCLPTAGCWIPEIWQPRSASVCFAATRSPYGDLALHLWLRTPWVERPQLAEDHYNCQMPRLAVLLNAVG